MKRIFMILAMASLLVGCRSNDNRGGMGGTGVEPGYDSGSVTNDIDNHSNLPGGDARPSRDGDSTHGIMPD